MLWFRYILLLDEPRHEKTNNVVLNWSNTNRALQAQKTARSWKFWIQEEEELYCPCSKNKGTDQLRSYCEADLHLCFRICKMLDFS